MKRIKIILSTIALFMFASFVLGAQDHNGTPGNPPVATPPSILTHPSDVNAITGASVIFDVNASGTAPLTYQWQKDGVDITGSTAAMLKLSKVQGDNNGTYRVIISNGAGSVTSNNATLAVGGPEPWWKTKFIGNNLRDWLIALGITLAAIMLARTVYWVIEKYVKKITEKTQTKIDDILINTIEKPMVAASGLAGVWFGVNYLTFSESVDHWINSFFTVLITLVGAWLTTRLFDSLVDEYLAPILADTETDLDAVLLPIVRRGVKVIIWAMAIIMALDNAGYNITTVLAGLGVGGLALALAAQDSAKNIFGVFTIFTDTPFKLGERIKASGYDGTVTEIGLRSTKIKTLEGRTVIIPNAEFADSAVENISSEPARKVALNLGLTYDMDDKQIEKAMQILRDIAAEHEEDIQENLSIGFNAFGDFALNIVFIYYIRKEADILGTQTRMNLEIIKRFNEGKIELAFPSQTIYTKALD